MRKSLPQGIYCPVPCFFTNDEDIDYDTFNKHILRVSRAGCIPLISGTLGEAIHLVCRGSSLRTHVMNGLYPLFQHAKDEAERKQLITSARTALDTAGMETVAIVAGAGSPSTLGSIRLAKDAADAGADAVLVVPSGYYGGILKGNLASLEQHFVDVASGSPIPVMIYDSVYATGGIDLPDSLIANVAKRAPTSCGVKLTCPSAGKVTRLAQEIHSPEFGSAYPRKTESAPFLVLTGLIDNLLAAASVGADGCIGGPPNFAPIASARLWTLSQKPLCGNNLREAIYLQQVLARADALVFDAGVPALKWLLGDLYGCSKSPRRPLPTYSDIQGSQLKAALEEVFSVESALERGEPLTF